MFEEKEKFIINAGQIGVVGGVICVKIVLSLEVWRPYTYQSK